MQVKIAGVEQRMRKVFAQLPRGLGIEVVFNQLSTPDLMAGEIFHHHHRKRRVVMDNVHRVLRAVLVVRH